MNESGTSPSPPPRDGKRLLREQVSRARDALPVETRVRFARAIVAGLTAREDFRQAHTVLLSLAFRSEWETRPLFDAAREHAKIVVVPRVNRETRMLDLYSVDDLRRDVACGYAGIDEPLPHCERVALAAIDWVLVPGVAFDLSGHRIGYGGGYYDRLLPVLRADARRIAGAFEVQIVERIPAAPHDVQVDAIVTESRTIVTRR